MRQMSDVDLHLWGLSDAPPDAVSDPEPAPFESREWTLLVMTEPCMINPDAPLGPAVQHLLPSGDNKLLLDGRRLDLKQSARANGLYDGAVLDCFHEQVGF